MSREKIITLAKKVFSEIDLSDLGTTFTELGIDSFDLISFRAELQSKLDITISNSDWVTCTSIQDIIKNAKNEIREPNNHPDQVEKRQLTLNMPQMAVGGISESWYFKEIGGMHWENICATLKQKSHSITDSENNRLYATFVRILYKSSAPLNQFKENEKIELSCQLSRFGKSMFFSESNTVGNDKNIKATLMSTFAMRGENNEKLLKGEPIIPSDSIILEHNEMPAFVEQYRAVRAEKIQTIKLDGEEIPVGQENLFEYEYTLNPYHDFNGVNLLYFAAYPIINENCERQYVHTKKEEYGVKKDWSMDASVIARDCYYFGNCEVNDSLVYTLNAVVKVSKGRYCFASSVSRKSDSKLLARFFTVKENT